MHPQQQTKRVGSRATFKCLLNSLEFTFNGGVLPSNAVSIFPLKIRNISKDNQGVYQCFGTTTLNYVQFIPVETYGILNVSG